jgi:4-amino-4-deoxy-L-arabinose transferase-like glycosyltransferase
MRHSHSQFRVSTPSNPARRRRYLLMVFLIGLLLRISGMLLTHSYRIKLDKTETANIAAAIASGQGFSNPFFETQTGPTAWIAPVYPFLLSRFFVAFGSYSKTAIICAMLFSWVFASLTCIPVYFIAIYSFGERLAERSALVWAIFPYTVYWGMQGVWETCLSTFLLTVLFMMTLQLAESSTPLKWAFYGLLWGLAGLTNTAELAFLPFAGCWICYRQFRQGKPFFRNAAVGAVLFFATVAPWTIRNYRVFHKFIPIRGNFGEEFHLGNTPDALGNWQVFLHPTTNILELRLYQQMGEVAYIHSKLEQTLQFVHDRPERFAYLTFAHFVYFWASPPHAERLPGLYETKTFFYLCSSVFAFWGLLLALRQCLPGAHLYLLLLLSYPAVYYITFPHPRYRHPIEPELLILIVFLASQFSVPSSQYLVPRFPLRTEN